jgi:3-hydroxyisobutyrate dehydrogenase
MGSRMAKQLIQNGHELVVWNRSHEKTEALVEQGASFASSPADAAREAEFVLSMLRDDQASHDVWLNPEHGAFSTMQQNAIAIECSTLSLKGIQSLHKAARDLNLTLVDAPVAGSRPQADAAKLIFLAGSSESTFSRIEGLLTQMGGAIHRCGEPGAGSVVKLAINSLFGIQVIAMAEILSLLKSSDVDLKAAKDIIATTPVCSPAASLSADAILTENFAAAFPIELVEKDFGYACEKVCELSVSTLGESAHRIFSEALKKGLGGLNITGVAKLYS